MQGCSFALGPWRPQFQHYLASHLQARWPTMRERILYHARAICKVSPLNLDNLLPIFSPFYPHTGRPVHGKLEILPSSDTRWVQIPCSDKILAIGCRFSPREHPRHRHLPRLPEPVLPAAQATPPTPQAGPQTLPPPAPGQKQPPNAGAIRKIVNPLLRGRRFQDKADMILKQILAHAVVTPSAKGVSCETPPRLPWQPTAPSTKAEARTRHQDLRLRGSLLLPAALLEPRG